MELARCLASIAAGTRLPLEVVVSNDSADSDISSQIMDICARYPFVRFAIGPRRGLCANRNYVIGRAAGTHLSLLDDDAAVGKEFVELCLLEINSHPLEILTGDILENGRSRQPPTNPTFLGYFGRLVANEKLANVNLNCNVFPRHALEIVQFDESIVYGYEDTDLCARLIEAGLSIRHCPEILNQHLPPRKPRKQLRQQQLAAEMARGQVQVRLRRRRGQTIAAVGWSVAAAAHAGVSAMRHADFARLSFVLQGIRKGWSDANRAS